MRLVTLSTIVTSSLYAGTIMRERLGEVSLVDEVEVLDEVAGHPPAHLAGGEPDQPQGVGVVEHEVQQKDRLHHQRENDERRE